MVIDRLPLQQEDPSRSLHTDSRPSIDSSAVLPPASRLGSHYYQASPSAQYPPVSVYPAYSASAPLPVHHHGASNGKRVASAHPGELPAKKKQTKWTAEEDAAIIELRGNGMKWEDISKKLPSRSAISCRLRFQNYLERRSEWDEEKKNKLARLYERFKKDMWEKIAKEMQLPWRAAEAMHWQIGEVEMATRANVPVFHLAGQSSGSVSGASDSGRPTSTSPSSSVLHAFPMHYNQQMHSHTLPQMSQPGSGLLRSLSRRNSGESSPLDPGYRYRADSVRSVHQHAHPNNRLPSLPPLGSITGALPGPMGLPPSLTAAEVGRK